MSPHANETRHQSQWFISGKNKGGLGRDGGERMIQRLNEESGRQEMLEQAHGDDASKVEHNHRTDCWLTPTLLLTVLNFI